MLIFRLPREPIRTLAALHLAGARAARREIPEIRLFSLDRRVRDEARELGFSLEPDAAIQRRKAACGGV